MRQTRTKPLTTITFGLFIATWLAGQLAAGQLHGGVYDFGLGRYGERRGDFTPAEWLSIILLAMTILAGLAFSIGLCYYSLRRDTSSSTSDSTARHEKLVAQM